MCGYVQRKLAQSCDRYVIQHRNEMNKYCMINGIKRGREITED